MIHNQYRAIYNGRPKQIGILGECHDRRVEEVEFAYQVLSQYESIVEEGSTKQSLPRSISALRALRRAASIPAFIIGAPLALLTNYFLRRPLLSGAGEDERQFNFSLESVAVAKGKDFVKSEDLTFQSLMGWAISDVGSAFRIPLEIIRFHRYGDKTRHDTVAGQEFVRGGEDGFPKVSFLNRMLIDASNRDKIIASAIRDRLDKYDRVLGSMGLFHGIGVKRNLEAALGPLELVKQEYPVYMD